jgi:lipoprotein-anchoring transpeptidase ErfK/SrfK
MSIVSPEAAAASCVPALDRRAVLMGIAALSLAGCATSLQETVVQNSPPPPPLPEPPEPRAEASVDRPYAAMYGPVDDGAFRIPAVKLSDVNPAFLRTAVPYAASEPAGTIVIDPPRHYLYFVQPGGRAVRYGVGVGGEGFAWSGAANVHDKQEWPDWYPPKEMLARRPDLRKSMSELRGGLGMPGGLNNPLGARAMYLWQGNKDTLFRIHGTNEPWTIGRSVSSGCIRMINQDAIDLYGRTPAGAKVVVLPSRIG